MPDVKEKTSAPASSEQGNTRLLYPDLLRCILAFVVIGVHTVSKPWELLGPGDSAWQTLTVIDSFLRFCIPVFIMVSGMFFLDPAKKVTVKKIYTQSIPRIVAAYCFWSLVYSLLENGLTYGFSDRSVLKFILFDALKGHFTQWFLIMLVGLYMITPVLRLITKHGSRRMIEYFLLLSFLFGGLIPTGLKLLDDGMIKALGEYYFANFNLNFVMGFTGVYLAGYYFRTYSLSKRAKIILYISGVVSLVVTIAMTLILSFKKGYAVQIFWENLCPTVTLMGAAVFVFAKEQDTRFVKYPP